MHILISGRSRPEKMTDPGQQGQGTASAPNEPSNSLDHSTVANSQATTVCVRAVTWCQSPIPIAHWQTNHKLLYTPFGQSTSHYWVTVGNSLYLQVTTVQVVTASFIWLFCMIRTTTYNLCNFIVRKQLHSTTSSMQWGHTALSDLTSQHTPTHPPSLTTHLNNTAATAHCGP